MSVTTKKLFSTSILTSAVVLSLFAGGCGSDNTKETIIIQKDGDPDPQPNPTPMDGVTSMRVVHASPDAPAVDVYVEGWDAPVLTDVTFGDTSEYLELEPGEYNIQLRAAPSSVDDPVAYSTGTINIADGMRITAIAAGLLSSDQDADKFRILTFPEAWGPSGSGNAIIRVVHASPDAPSVGIDLHDNDPANPEVTGLDRFTTSDSAGVPLSAGEELQVAITASGQRVTAFTTPELPEGAQLFVIATGLTGKLAREADGFQLLAVGPEGTVGFIRQNPIVYALHASPNAPAVDAFAGGSEVISNLSFGNLAGPLQLPPGNYDLDFYGATAGSSQPAGAPAATSDTGELERGESYLTVATGLLGGTKAPFQLASYAEGFDRNLMTEPRLRVIHSSPDAPAVDVGILNVENVVNPVLVSDVTFPGASSAEGLVPGLGTIPLGVTPAFANSTVVASFHVTTSPGLRAFGVAAGALDPMNGESFRLLVVNTSTAPWSVATVHPQPQQPQP